jgi:hypothetical protein
VRVWRREAHLEKKGASFKEGGTPVHETCGGGALSEKLSA